jgi:hypothetical protein
MAKNKISEFDVNPDNNTDINNINIAEGCAPSGINNAIRQLMSDLKEQLTGASGDPFTVGGAFAANGGATLGDASGDALTINSSAVSIPNGLNFDSNTFVIDATNNRVSVGTNSPVSARQFTVSNTAGDAYININGGTGTTASPAFTTLEFRGYLSNRTAAIQSYDQSVDTALSGGLLFYTNANMVADSPTERMRIDASGNVGIGTSSPVTSLNIYKASGTFGLQIQNSLTGTASTDGVLYGIDATTLGAKVWNYDLTDMTFGTSNTERMRIDSAGNLLVGTTSNIDGRVSISANAGNSGCIATSNNGLSVYYPAYFYYNGGLNGNIATTSTATIYATSSDYRLKENIAPMTGALSVVNQLKPCTYTWKSDNSQGQGFIAHELQEVVPDCVIGEKDAVNEDGSIKPQSIDTSFLIATLTAAIQEQQAIITDLKSRIESLESK